MLDEPEPPYTNGQKMSIIATHFIPDHIDYTGEQLRSHWAYRRFDLLGDSIVAFVGACDVKPEFMKDVEDLKAASEIRSERMLHFIVEHFDTDLERAALRQRLLISAMAENLNRRMLVAQASRLQGARIERKGSDLYEGTRKLTVSIASVSAVSALIHAGINISSRNTPVPTRGLEDYSIAPEEFAREILHAYAAEMHSVWKARCKVRECE